MILTLTRRLHCIDIPQIMHSYRMSRENKEIADHQLKHIAELVDDPRRILAEHLDGVVWWT